MSSPSSIWCRDSNPRLLEHESSPITTRPGLPPYCWLMLFRTFLWSIWASVCYLFKAFKGTSLQGPMRANHFSHSSLVSKCVSNNLKKQKQTVLHLLFRILSLRCSFRCPVSVTRFGEILALCHNVKKLWSFWKSSFSIWKHFEPSLANFICFWAIFQCCKCKVLNTQSSNLVTLSPLRLSILAAFV